MTTSLTLRSVKGSPLTSTEGDNNLIALRNTADAAKSTADAAQTATAAAAYQALLAGNTGASQVGYLAPYTGAVARLQSSKNNDCINVADFMTSAQLADVLAGSLTAGFSTANTNSVQAAINACGNLGKNLILPDGPILVDDSNAVNNYCLIVTRPITITGSGFNSAITPKSTVGATADTIRIDPSPLYWCKIKLENFTIGSNISGTRYGNRGVFLRTDAVGSAAPKFTMRDMVIHQGSGGTGEAFVHINNATNNTGGGMYAALIENCSLTGGISLQSSGDSNVIQKNIISGSNIGIYYSLVNGASCLNIEANNITATGGAIKGDRGSRTVIRHNNIEHPSGAGSNSAIIDLNNNNGIAYGGIVEQNLISGFGTSTATTCLRIRSSNGLIVKGNVFLSGVSGLITAINAVDGSVANLKIEPNTYNSLYFTPAAYSGGTTYAVGAYVTSAGYNWISLQAGNIGHTPETSPTWWTLTSGPKILDGGQGTCGVIKPLPALQAGWVYYGSSRSFPLMYKDCNGVVHLQGAISTGTATAGTTILTLPTYFRPKLLLPVNVHSTGGAVAGLGTIYLYGTGAGGGELTIQAGGNTLLSLDGVSFLADGLADGVSAE